MGISTDSMELVDEVLVKVSATCDKIRMIELGNQFLYLNPSSGIPHLTVAKGYFEAKGIQHTSIDQNGNDGALKLDLSKPIPPSQLANSEAEIVTNFGVAEHVSNLYWCLRNMHDFCIPGGYMIHVVPLIKNWPGHGDHFFTEKSFQQLADLNNYTVERMRIQVGSGNYKTGRMVACVLKKQEYDKFDFISEQAFSDGVEIFPS